MALLLTIVGRIIIQGPQAPLAGDVLALPVYEYEVVEPAGELRQDEQLNVAHRAADVDDPGFAAGRLRRLSLTREFPAGATLLFLRDAPRRDGNLWFCPESTPIAGGTPSSAPTAPGRTPD
jgi:hypothetical protein